MMIYFNKILLEEITKGSYIMRIYSHGGTMSVSLFSKNVLFGSCTLYSNSDHSENYLLNFRVIEQNKGLGSFFLQMLFQSNTFRGALIYLKFFNNSQLYHFYSKNMDRIEKDPDELHILRAYKQC